MATIEKALQIAARAHEGQRDKEGQPYILHPLRVMARVETDAERVVAVLHDAVEQGPDRVRLARLRDEGFPEGIVEAVDCLTRRDGEAYDDLIERLAPNALARRVKLADLAENLDLLRRSALARRLRGSADATARLAPPQGDVGSGNLTGEPDGVTGRCVLPELDGRPRTREEDPR